MLGILHEVLQWNDSNLHCRAMQCEFYFSNQLFQELFTGEIPVQQANGSSEGVQGHLRVQVLRYKDAGEGQPQKRMHWLLARETKEDGIINSGQD